MFLMAPHVSLIILFGSKNLLAQRARNSFLYIEGSSGQFYESILRSVACYLWMPLLQVAFAVNGRGEGLEAVERTNINLPVDLSGVLHPLVTPRIFSFRGDTVRGKADVRSEIAINMFPSGVR